MSYILDALRKSEQLRQNGVPPTLSTAPTPANVAASKKTAVFTYGLIALTLVGIGVGIGWLRPWQHEQPPPASKPATTLAVTQPANPAIPAPSSTQVPEPVKASVSPMPSPTQQPDTKPNAEIAPKTAPQSSASQLKQQPATPAPAPEPKSTQTDLPNITITVHAYSADPKERLAGINGRLLLEGNEIAPGFRLERITEEGVILNFKGRRFRRSLQ